MTVTVPSRRHLLAAVALTIITCATTAARPAQPACAPTLTPDGPGVVLVDACGGVDELGAITTTEDGLVVIAGTTRVSSDAAAKLVVARLTPAGRLDTSFDGDGMVIDEKVGADVAPSGVVVTAEGNVVVVGTIRRPDASTRAFVAVKYTVAGKRDDTFGERGLAVARFKAKGSDSSSGGGAGPDDTAVVGGVTNATPDSPAEIIAFRYGNDGKADTSFGTNGVASTRIAGNDVTKGLGVAGVDLYGDGAVVLGGSVPAGSGTPAQLVLVQYTAAGVADPAFGQQGLVLNSAAGVPVQDIVLILQEDGSVVVAGKSGDSTAIARFSSAGVRDTSFNKGNASVDLAGKGDIIAVANAASGSVLLIGSSRTGHREYPDLVVLRFDGSGERDMSYADGGLARTTLSHNRGFQPVGIAVTTDQGVAVGGTARATGPSDLVVVRLDPAGKPDTTFAGAQK